MESLNSTPNATYPTNIRTISDFEINALKVDDEVYYWTRFFIVTIVSVFIIISNILNICILTRKCHIPKISRMFLVNLSISDLCVGLFSCLPTLYSAVTEYWPYGAVWCQIAGIFHGTSCAISIWSISMVSIDRYLAICKPMTYATWKSTRKAFIVILCLWTVAFVSFIAPLLTKSDFIYYQFDKNENMCGLYWEYKWFCILTGVYIPILSGGLLVFTNFKIIKTIIKRKHDLHKSDGRSSAHRRGISAVKLLVTTSSIYFLAWGPYVVAVLLMSFIDGFHLPGKLRFFFIWLANSNSFMDVITFSVVYRAFRHELKRFLLSCLCCIKCSTRIKMSCESRAMEGRNDYTSDAGSEPLEMRQSTQLSTAISTINAISIDTAD